MLVAYAMRAVFMLRALLLRYVSFRTAEMMGSAHLEPEVVLIFAYPPHQPKAHDIRPCQRRSPDPAALICRPIVGVADGIFSDHVCPPSETSTSRGRARLFRASTSVSSANASPWPGVRPRWNSDQVLMAIHCRSGITAVPLYSPEHHQTDPSRR